MRVRLRDLFSLLPVLAAIVFLVLNPAKASAAACEGVQQSMTQVFPALFPFFVLTKLLLSRGGSGNPPRLLRRFSERLFAVPASALPVFLLSLVSGCPVGAAAAAELYQRGGCTKEEAERLLVYSSNCGPAFLLGVVSPRLPGGMKDALFLLITQILLSVWLGVLLGAGKNASLQSDRPGAKEKAPFVRAFTDAVLSGGRNALIVCAYVVFFSAATASLPKIPLVRGLGEMTGGILLLSPEKPYALPTAAFLLGFGGLSVACQVLAAISDAELSGRLYFPFRLLHGCVMVCAAMLYECCPLLLPVLGFLLFFSAICVKKGGKRRINAVYSALRGENNNAVS